MVSLACTLLAVASAAEPALARRVSADVSAHSASNCDQRESRNTVTRFLAAFNRGDLRQLNRFVAPDSAFRWYAVNGAPGARVGPAAYARSTLTRYFAERHAHSERLVLERFGFSGRSLGTASFWFEVLRSAGDLELTALYVGKGAVTCYGARGIAVWAMGPNSEPTLPVPQSYVETCQLVSSWCTLDPSIGGLPDALRRPLALPSQSGGVCPTTSGQRFDNSQFGGIVLGHGPVQPLLGSVSNADAARAEQGVLVLRPYAGQQGWYAMKTLWFASPDYQGPVLIRGRQLDGPHAIAFGEAPPSLVDPQIGPGATLNGIDGWREWPGGTWLRTPGCYAWQIDGTDFSEVIVFKAVFAPAA